MGVAHRTTSAPRDQFKCFVVGLHVLGLDDVAQPLHDSRQRNTGEVETLTAKADEGDGLQDFFGPVFEDGLYFAGELIPQGAIDQPMIEG